MIPRRNPSNIRQVPATSAWGGNASRRRTSQQPYSARNRNTVGRQRHGRQDVLRADQNGAAQPPRRRHRLAIRTLRRTRIDPPQAGHRQRSRDSRRWPARERWWAIHLRRGLPEPGNGPLGRQIPRYDGFRKSGQPRVAAVQQLQNARDGGAERPGIGCLPCE